MSLPNIFWVVPAAGVITIIFAIFLIRNVMKRPTGTPKMKEIGDIIFQGAWAFLKRQYSTIAMYSVAIAIIIGVLVGVLGHTGVEQYGYSGLDVGWRTGVAFLVGALCSGLAGFIGMYIAVKSNVRCAAAAQRSLKEAVEVALRGGAVSGFLITALSLIGVTVIFFAYGGNTHPQIAPHLIVGFGFGASFVALFAQLGGGIYTKAADVGADLVGKVESGIPEDDPRNPAVIADLVGDNVGDCAGRGADLFESTAAENIGAMILGVFAYMATNNIAWILFPLCVRGFGMFASMIGLLCVRAKENENAMNALNRGYFVAIGLSVVGLAVTVYYMLDNWWLFGAGLVGIAASIVIVFVTQYYTDSKYRPVRDIAEASKTGPATNIIMGMSVGFSTTFATAIIIGVSLILAYWMGAQSGVQGAGAFGTAVATMGMLMTCPYVLSMDTFGPITDNANGINEMAGAGPEVRKITDRLDAVGNTTKALTKGYAMVSAGLAAFLLFQAYLDRVSLIKFGTEGMYNVVNLANISVFVGALLAAMIVYLFSAWAIKAVGKTASKIIEEVRRQFRADPEILHPKDPEHPHMPDYAKCVDITTRAGLREMIAPGLLPVLGPIVIGVAFKYIGKIPSFASMNIDAAMVVAGVLMVGTISGILMASFMNNGGGAWDNAKKMIEDGQLKDENGAVLGKKSFAHQAAVVGDTLGDPLKDTAGPSLHVLVKLLATITLVMCPLFI
ncbi:MAG: sodium-translocating pyrophosphatase [Dehalococcoidales bacterium]|jgi:K(+)-stimulated pyrophosphate-energized sodium pump